MLAYDDIDRGLNYFTYEMGANIKVGMVIGEDHMSNIASCREIAKSLLTEAGEKWKDFKKKLDVFVSTKEAPFKARSFAINYGYRLEENDQILVFNYASVSIDTLKKEIDIEVRGEIYMPKSSFDKLNEESKEKEYIYFFQKSLQGA